MSNGFAGVFNQQHSADLGSKQAEEKMTHNFMDVTLNDSRADDDDYEETQKRQQDFLSVSATGICPLEVAPKFEAFENMSVEDHVKRVGDSNSVFEPLSSMKRRSSLKAAGIFSNTFNRVVRHELCESHKNKTDSNLRCPKLSSFRSLLASATAVRTYVESKGQKELLRNVTQIMRNK
ncbi:hypothetical protein GQX74_002019 [Glossina fuscipes]|nr:hypothetical protein GQX74_002019 [Glossina fuscipes]